MKNKITIGLVIVAAVVAGALGAWFFMPSASGIAGERVEKEQKMSKTVRSGSVKKITEISKRLPLLKDELDEKSMRWLELSEIEH